MQEYCGFRMWGRIYTWVACGQGIRCEEDKVLWSSQHQAIHQGSWYFTPAVAGRKRECCHILPFFDGHKLPIVHQRSKENPQAKGRAYHQRSRKPFKGLEKVRRHDLRHRLRTPERCSSSTRKDAEIKRRTPIFPHPTFQKTRNLKPQQNILPRKAP